MEGGKSHSRAVGEAKEAEEDDDEEEDEEEKYRVEREEGGEKGVEGRPVESPGGRKKG